MKRRQHGSATTTPAIRRAIQSSRESLLTLAARYSVNPKTIQKWRKRAFIQDARMGPTAPRLSKLEENIVVAFRRHTLLPLDDCLYALQVTLPHLTRTTLYRCLQRYGVSRIPNAAQRSAPGQSQPLGFFRLDVDVIESAEGQESIFVAVDRTSELVFTQVHPKADRQAANRFLVSLIAAVPYRIHTVLTENRHPFAAGPKRRSAVPKQRAHRFNITCRRNGITHRLSGPNHPWTSRQVARLRRLLDNARTHNYLFQTRREAREGAIQFRVDYNLHRRLKSLGGLTPHAYVCRAWTRYPDLFWSNPHHHTWN